MLSALDIAWFFISKGSKDDSMTQLRVLKLVYYAQGFYLGLYGKPLFSGDIEAWEYGPVVLDVRRHLITYGAKPIPLIEKPSEVAIQDQQIIQFLERIWHYFGGYTAGQLVDMTHQEEPWIEAYYRNRGGHMISQEIMKTYFSSRAGELRGCTSSNSADIDTCWTLSDLEETVSQINEPEYSSGHQFSGAFIDSSNRLAQKLATQANRGHSEELIKKLAQTLASYED